MGSDEPRSFISPMPGGVMPQTKTSGGEQSPLPNFAVVGRPYDLSGIADALGGIAKNMAAKMGREKREREEQERAVELTRLTTQTALDNVQGFDQYKSTYSGPSDNFTEGYMQTYDQYANQVKTGIKDQKLKSAYEQFSLQQRMKIQIQALGEQNNLFNREYTEKFNSAKSQIDDLVQRDPTPETLNLALQSLDVIYNPLRERLRQSGYEEKATEELQAAKQGLTTSMILRQAQTDPDQALASIHNPDINQWFQTVEAKDAVESKVLSIKEHKNQALEAQAKTTLNSYIEAVAAGKDVSKLQSDLNNYANLGVMDGGMVDQMNLANQMAPRYADLRNSMVALSDEQFEEALASLDPVNDIGGQADANYQDFEQFHHKFASALRSQRAVMKRNPVATMAGITGETDPETATLQYVAARLRTGENIENINVLDDAVLSTTLNQLNNAVLSGNVDQIINVFDQIKQNYGADEQHRYRQVAPGVDLADMVLNQMARNKDHPISRKVVAAYHLISRNPQAGPQNNLLLRASLMKDDQRASLLQSAQMVPFQNKVSMLDKWLADNNPTWRNYFKVSREMTPETASLMQSQKSVLLDTMLLNIASGDVAPSGGWQVGLWKLGETPAAENAATKIIESYIPFKAITVSGNPILTENKKDALNVFGVNTSVKQLDIFGMKTTIARKDWRMNIRSSELVVPQEFSDRVTPDLVTQFISSKLLDKNYVFNNASLPGVNDNVTAPASVNWKKPEPFIARVNQIGKKVGADPNDLMAVMSIESGLRADAKNSKSTATGLIQWMNMPNGMSRDQFAAMDEMQQLNYVEQWFSRHRGKLDSPGKVYLAVAAPGVLSQLPANASPNTVVYPAGSKAAKANPMWQDKAGNVTLGKLDSLVRGRKMQMGIKSGPSSYDQLPTGQRMLLDQKFDMITKDLLLKNTGDRRGVRVYAKINGQDVPIPTKSGGFIEYSFDEISRYNPSITRR